MQLVNSESELSHPYTKVACKLPKALFCPLSLFQSLHRCWRSWRYVSSSPVGPRRLADDIIPTGPARPQVLPVDGFDRQCDRGRHDTHTAVPVSPQTAVGSPHCEGPADRCVYTEPWGHL